MEEITDYELIYMIRQNDETAYRMLYERYVPLLWRKVYDCQKQYYEYLPDVSDAFNECMMTFQDVVYSYRLDRKTLFGTYLYNCLDFSLKNYRRTLEKHERRMMRGDLIDEIEINQLPDTSLKYDPASIYNATEIMKLIDELLESYPEPEKEIIYKTIYGMRGIDIADEYNLPRKKYSYIVRKFREKALKMLEKKEYN